MAACMLLTASKSCRPDTANHWFLRHKTWCPALTLSISAQTGPILHRREKIFYPLVSRQRVGPNRRSCVLTEARTHDRCSKLLPKDQSQEEADVPPPSEGAADV